MDKLKTKMGWKNNLDKLLFIIASLYLIFMGGLWLKNQQKTADSSTVTVNENQTITQSNSTETNTDNSPKTHNNSNNISNNEINNQENIDSQLLPTISPSSTPLEIPPLPNNQTIASNIPLPPPDLQPLPIPQPPQPTFNSSTPISINQKVNPQPSSTSVTNNSQANQVSSPIPKVNKVPILNSLSTNNQSQTSTPVAINSLNPNSENIVEATGGDYTLVGLVQLPDSKSMALFRVNNLTEKVLVGNEIGLTGWVLMAVNDRQAVVSKQNESVYLRVGENF